MKRILMLSLIAPSLVAATAVAARATTAEEALGYVDQAMAAAEDQTFEYEIVHQEPGKDARRMVMVVHIKGEMRLTEFLAPGDMKGTKALVRSRTQAYVYLPSYNKVRRVASHATEGSLFGTTLNSEDMAATSYGPTFVPELIGETETSWTLKLLPRPDADTSYGRLEMDVSKRFHHPTEIRYFAKSGQHSKTEIRSGYGCRGDVCNFEELKMTDLTRGGAWTKLVRRRWEVDSGLSDSLFSVRKLAR